MFGTHRAGEVRQHPKLAGPTENLRLPGGAAMLCGALLSGLWLERFILHKIFWFSFKNK